MLVVAQTTCPSTELAHTLATGAVTLGLAACAQVGAEVQSVYQWQGRMCCEAETPLTFKTTVQQCEALRLWLHERHPYEVPDWVVWPVCSQHSSQAYQAWVVAACGGAG
jgi:periplasmic divalent cation tolerance protein